MATQFTAIGIPYPPATDNNDTVGAIAALAAFIDPVLKSSYTQAQIDAFAGATQLWTGRRVFNSTRATYQWYNGAAWVDVIALVMAAKVANYQLVLADANGVLVQMNMAGANTLTIPNDATVAFPLGTVINLLEYGAGQTTIISTAPAVIRATPGTKLRAQYSTATLVKLAANEWLLTGDIVP